MMLCMKLGIKLTREGNEDAYNRRLKQLTSNRTRTVAHILIFSIWTSIYLKNSAHNIAFDTSLNSSLLAILLKVLYLVGILRNRTF